MLIVNAAAAWTPELLAPAVVKREPINEPTMAITMLGSMKLATRGVPIVGSADTHSVVAQHATSGAVIAISTCGNARRRATTPQLKARKATIVALRGSKRIQSVKLTSPKSEFKLTGFAMQGDRASKTGDVDHWPSMGW